MRTVTVKGVTLGEGMPKIVVPLTGADPDQLAAQATALHGHAVDVVEWRADFFTRLGEVDAVVDQARSLGDQLAGTPLLFTCRTRAEGGAAEIEDEDYGRLNTAVIDAGAADLVDVEYRRSPAVVDRVLAAAHAAGVAVIVSSHDFDGTPSRGEIVARLQAMQEVGADICKVAVMPHSVADVLALLDATRTMNEQFADRPLITMSMGPLGTISRVAGQVFGSAATFGMVGTASAPGQVDADDLRTVLRVLAGG
ncbi:type I 3-dehydroquinate dehydratase [Georgenia yuyongxinii]|uniref:3-dehydroquinate dehydratase n=1 Tax=Georgenia yuyongxinii TaxID=2589797 RepID=A0A552WVH1_9MICO|nr:type I 3-dehydroquinate dehydratase [Georgenia yuyongxinii]